MRQNVILSAGALMICMTAPALGQQLPIALQGSWDVSIEECRNEGTSVTQIDIKPDAIDTFGGDASVRDIEQSGPVTFVAADYLQLEGAVEPGERERVYYRLTQRDGPDRLGFIWKDVMATDLVRCRDDGTPHQDSSSDRLRGTTTDKAAARSS